MYVTCFNLPRAEPVKSQICPFYVWPSCYIFEFYVCQIFIQTKFPNMASLRYEWMLRGFFLRPLPHLPPKRQYNIELFCLLFPWISTPVQTVRKGSRLTISDVSSPKLVLQSGYDFIHAYQGIHRHSLKSVAFNNWDAPLSWALEELSSKAVMCYCCYCLFLFFQS